VVPARARRWLRSLPYRVYVIRTYRLLQRSPIEALRFIVVGRELDNFTYEIANEGELASFLNEAVGISTANSVGYIAELQGDSELRSAIEAKLRGRHDRNRTMPYGRRLGWYAIVRARKPKLVVETGVHDGLGSAVLLRALQRNAADGVDGMLVSFDINEQAGWLIPDFLRSRHELEIGSAPACFVEAFKGRRVDLFVHDSDHGFEHEMAEFEAIAPLCAPNAVLITDNAFGAAFPDFCERLGLTTHLFREIPQGHWYPGAGIRLAIRP
jgi:Methyltransferase domain